MFLKFKGFSKHYVIHLYKNLSSRTFLDKKRQLTTLFMALKAVTESTFYMIKKS